MATADELSQARLLGVNLKFPLQKDASGNIAVSYGADLVRESLEMLILTDPMERPYRVRNGVQYGTRLRRLLFEGFTTAQAIADQDIRRAVAIWEPRVELLNLTIERSRGAASGSDDTMVVKLVYRIRSTGQQEFHVVRVSKDAQP
jgi:phage baseplate assembly protein W